MGNSIMSHLRGLSRVHFVSRPHEIYVCTYPTLYARGILFGSMFLELGDNASVTCENLDLIAEMDFKVKVCSMKRQSSLNFRDFSPGPIILSLSKSKKFLLGKC